MSKESTDRYKDLIIDGNDIPKPKTIWQKVVTKVTSIGRKKK